MVDERNAVYAPLVSIAENNIYAAVFQLGCKIILIGGAGKNIDNSAPCRCHINLVLRFLETVVNRRAACKFAEARSLERVGDYLAFVVGGKIHQTVILAPVDSTVGLLTPYII